MLLHIVAYWCIWLNHVCDTFSGSLCLCAYIHCECLGLFSSSIRACFNCIICKFCSGMPPISVEDQSRCQLHRHFFKWNANLYGSTPSTRATNNGSGEHSTDSTSLRAYVAGYCTKGEPTQSKHLGGGETKGAQKTTQEDSS